MDEEYIIRLLRTFNRQWEGKKTEIPHFKRELYSKINKYLKRKQIIALTGLRRVGKTTLMKQMISELAPKSCVYFSFDEKDLQNKEVLTFVINYFLNNFKGKYFFLDEIHYIPDWQGILKRYYDTNNLKFIISGSASMQIRKGKESLAGRIITFHLPTLSFREFLMLGGEKIEMKKDLKKTYESLLPRKEFFEKMFNEYIYKGGFPELVKEEDTEFIRTYLNEMIIRKILLEDIPDLFDIKRKEALYNLFRYACKESSNLFEINNLANNLKIDSDTVSNYLIYLELSFLIKVSENYSESMATRIRKNKKLHIVHPCLAFSILNYPKSFLDSEILVSHYVESLFAGKSFWRSKEKEEVNCIININGKPMPVEIKYRNRITKKDSKGLLKFCDKFNCNEGIMVTKNLFREEKIKKLNSSLHGCFL